MYFSHLKLIIHRAFLGAIKQNVRAIAYHYTDTHICIYTYLDQEPTEEDYDIIDCAITEIMADCPQFQTQNMIITKTNTPIGLLNAYKGWIFVRSED